MPARTEFNLTGFLDGLFEGVSRNTGVPSEDYSAITGGITYGALEDVVLDLILKPFPSAVVQSLTGLGMIVYSAFAEGVDPRLRKEVYTWGMKSVSEILDPGNFVASKVSAEEIFEKIQNKADINEIIGAIFRTPEELSKMFGLEEKKKPVKTTKSEVREIVVPVETAEEPAGEYEENEEEEKKWRNLSA